MLDKKTQEDMDVLKAILEGKAEIKDLDKNQKMRLLVLCKNRTKEINDKIEIRKKEIELLDELL